MAGGVVDRVGAAEFCGEEPHPATVSPFALDRHAVTVARFRAFVDAGGGSIRSAPQPGEGAHPSAPDSGWRVEWNAHLVASRESLEESLRCSERASWTPQAGDNEGLPITCVDWYTAFAFCVWDGGRLPSEAEWAFAARGGDEARTVPWRAPGDHTPVRQDEATFGAPGPLPVGAHSPAGDGAFGHADLVGNTWEWTLDAAPEGHLLPTEGADFCDPTGLPVPCVDCVASEGALRVSRSSGWGLPEQAMRTTIRRADPPTDRAHVFGVRCARSVEGPAAMVAEPVEGSGERFALPAVGALVTDWRFTSVDGAEGTQVAAAPRSGVHVLVFATLWDAPPTAALEHARSAGVAARVVLVQGARQGQGADIGNLDTWNALPALPDAMIDVSERSWRLFDAGVRLVAVNADAEVVALGTDEAAFWTTASGR